MRVSVIVKAGHEIGLGHLTRGHSFAKAAKRRGHVVQFIYITDSSYLFLQLDRSIAYLRFAEFEHAYKYLSDFSPDLIVLDLLEINNKVAKLISDLSTINVCLSPKFNRKDIIHFHFSRAYLSDWPQHTKTYIGLEYVIISEHISRIDNHSYYNYLMTNPLPISICMGGSDPSNLTLQVLKALSHIDNIHPYVFLGSAFKHAVESIRDVSAHFPSFTLNSFPEKVWSYMNSIPIAILSGGLMAFESAYAGIPSINLLRSEEQKKLVYGLESKEACIVSDINSLRSIIIRLEKNRHDILQMRNRCLLLDLKNGSDRCLDVLEYEICS